MPAMADAAKFAKLYSDPGEDGMVLRRWVNSLKRIDASGTYLSGSNEEQVEDDECDDTPEIAGEDALDTQGEDEDRNDDELGELKAKAAALRKVQPHLSAEQAFTKAYEDPANRDLVRRERLRNRPRAA
jgi:hypothetical protein